MACDICRELAEQLLDAIADQHQAEATLDQAISDAEREAALVALAHSRLRRIRVERELREHRERGC